MRLLLNFVAVFISLSPLLAQQPTCLKGNCINGYGECKFPNGDLYKGDFKNSKLHGKGILEMSNGDKYLGDWVNQYRQGTGKLIFANGDQYLGAFVQDKFSGKGTMTYTNGDRYEGFWLANKPDGEGTLLYASGARYEGQFKEGVFEGQGIMTYADGARYNGLWKNNKRHGEGTLTTATGETLTGTWENDHYQAEWGSVTFQGDTSNLRNCNTVYCAAGLGKFTYKNGDKYIGDFQDGKPQGTGIVYYQNGERYEGQWKTDAPNGKGVMHYADGKAVGAIWDAGKLIQPLFEDVHPAGKGSTVIIDYNKEVKIWAIVIGAARYASMPTLKYTDDDAYQVYAFLKSPEGGALPDNQIRLLIDEDATRSNILFAMRAIFTRADENDVILFYFSGHGVEGAFLPIDFDGINNTLQHSEIRDLLMASKAKHRIVLADACHSGGLLAMKTPIHLEVEKLYKAFEDSKGGTALLMSSKGEEYSLEDGGLRSGVFSHFMIRGLKGEADQNSDKIVNIQELYNYTYKQVRKYTASVQTPVLTGTFDPGMPVAIVRH